MRLVIDVIELPVARDREAAQVRDLTLPRPIDEARPPALGEFRYGISGSRHRGAYDQWLEDHLPEFEILTVTEPTTLAYARVRLSLKKLGRPIPANDT